MSRLEEVATDALALAKHLGDALMSSDLSDREARAELVGAATQLRRHVAWLQGYAQSAEQMADEHYPTSWATFSCQAATEGGAR